MFSMACINHMPCPPTMTANFRSISFSITSSASINIYLWLIIKNLSLLLYTKRTNHMLLRTNMVRWNKIFWRINNFGHDKCSKHSSQIRALIPLVGKNWGGNTKKISNNKNWGTPHIREWHHLQPKTLRHWVCGSSFSYAAQLHIDTLPLERKRMTPYLYRRSHTYTGHTYLKLPSRRLSIQGQTEPIRLVTKTNHRLWYHLLGKSEGETLRRSQENWVTPHITEWHHIQSKTLRHWVCGSYFLYAAQLHIDTLPLERKRTTPYLYHRSHTYTGHTCLKPPSGKLSIQGQTESICPMTKTNHRLWYHLVGKSEGETLRRYQTMRIESYHI